MIVEAARDICELVIETRFLECYMMLIEKQYPNQEE
jgi:hypothetical protein